MYLGIDLGTGSVKVMLVDQCGAERVITESYPIEAPQAGFAETDPSAWIVAIRKALSNLPDLSTLRGIGFSGQMHGIVPLDDEGNAPLGRAILWADQRGGKYLDRFNELPESMRSNIMNAPAAGMSATTLLWLKNESPDFYNRIGTALFPKDYLRFVMTGRRATDYSDASGSLLYNFNARSWYGELVRGLGLSLAYLPDILAGTDRAGVVTAAGAAAFGLPEGVPVAVGGGDAPTGMFGSGLSSEDEIQISVGTAAQISRPVPSDVCPAWNPSLNLFEGVRAIDRYQVAAMLNAGIALEWVRRVLKRDWTEIYAALEGRDLGLKPDIMFLPYLSGERTPYMDPSARGAWLGLGLHHTDMDLAFAALVGVACAIRLGLETIGTSGVNRIRAVGGSLKYPYWRRLIASIIGRSIDVTEQTDISARGAARIAAVMGGDVFPEIDAPYVACHGEELPWLQEYFHAFKENYLRLNEKRT